MKKTAQGQLEHKAPAISGAIFVASGIFLSRIAGFVRESIFAYFFGRSAVADAFRAALRIPNLLQNLFGEGVLSASLIPVYAGLRARGNTSEARDVASAIAVLLSLFTAAITLAGILFTPVLIDIIVPGFTGEKRLLAITLVRIFFPGTAMLVMSAWCLGILNSHGKFFLPYVAPVIWNGTIILALLFFGPGKDTIDLSHPAVLVAWGVTIGSFLQFFVQLPHAHRLLGSFRLILGLGLKSVREVLRNFVPVSIGRGVVQISAFIDTMIASWLPEGALAALTYAQTVYFLPVSLFGMSISAAELPLMSSTVGGDDEVKKVLQQRLNNGLRQISFLVVPSAVAFFVLGDVIVAFLYQSGRFTASDTNYVWLTLAGLGIGLAAGTMSRLCASTLYALKDTKTPLRYALIRVALNTLAGFFFSLYFPSLVGLDRSWGIVGLTAATGTSNWLEYVLIKRAVSRRVGSAGLPLKFVLTTWSCALSAAFLAFALNSSLSGLHPRLHAFLVLPVYVMLYFGFSYFSKVEEAGKMLKRVFRTSTS